MGSFCKQKIYVNIYLIINLILFVRKTSPKFKAQN